MSNQPKPYGFIYESILPDGRFYRGQHKIISQKTLDPTYFGSGVIIKDYIKSKGKQGIVRTILSYGFSFDEMNKLERQYITEEMMIDPKCINLDRGGKNKFSRWPEINKRIGETVAKRRAENPENWPKRKGQENNKSINWKFISPTGEEFIFWGDLSGFCKSKNISVNTIKKAVGEGWIPKRGSCAGWQAFRLDTGQGTTRDTLNHGESHSGLNNPWYKNKLQEKNNGH